MPALLAPRLWGVHLVGLVLVAVAVGLGLWQHGAWQAQRAAEATDLTLRAPLPLTEVIGPDDPFPGDQVGQPVIVDGTWLADGTVFVSGRAHEGRAGYWVATPLAVGDTTAPALYVVRGWVAEPADAPAPPAGPVELVAWLQPTEGTNESDPDRSDDVLPQMRTADLIQHVDQDLYGAYAVVADEVAPGAWPVGEAAVNDGTAGLAPATLEQLPEAERFTALRNLLYALEWWVFGAFAAFIWWRYVRDLTAEQPPEEATPEASGIDDSERVPSGS